jgi:hypothetical protein
MPKNVPTCESNTLPNGNTIFENKGVRCMYMIHSTVPEIIDPVFAKTSQNARFLLSENERFGLVFVKTGSINSGTVEFDDLIRTFCFFQRFQHTLDAMLPPLLCGRSRLCSDD